MAQNMPAGARPFLRFLDVWAEPRQNKKLLKRFELENTSRLPLFLVFAEGPKKEALRVAFKISGDSTDAVYSSLKTAIEVASDAIKDVREENIKNTFEVFSLIEGALHQKIAFSAA